MAGSVQNIVEKKTAKFGQACLRTSCANNNTVMQCGQLRADRELSERDL